MKPRRVMLYVTGADSNGEQHRFRLDRIVDGDVHTPDQASAKLLGYEFWVGLSKGETKRFEVVSVQKVKAHLESEATVIVNLGDFDSPGQPHPLTDTILEIEMHEGEGLLFNEDEYEANPRSGYWIRRLKTHYVVSDMGI